MFNRTNNTLRITLVIITALLLLFISFYIGRSSSTNSLQGSVNNQQPAAPKEKAKQNINREFTFPFNDDVNKKTSNIKYTIESVFLQDEIFIKGQRATAIKGKTFLVINLKLKNDYDQRVQVNARDYIRLSLNDGKEWLAPDIHNDPVEVQALSTKLTRVGFPINDSDKNLKLRIGQINGDKTTIDLHLN